MYERVLERLEPTGSRDQLESAGRLGRIPLAVHLEMCEALRDEVGRQAFRRYFCTTTLAASRQPLFRPLIDGFVQVFGISPLSTIKAAPRVWQIIFRGTGRLELESTSPNRVEAAVLQLHPSVRERDTLMLGVQGAFDAAIELADRRGHVELDNTDLSRGIARFAIRWL